MHEPTLEARELHAVFGRGGGAVTALSGVNASFHPGQLTVVMGPSGSGKTTLLSLLGCLLQPTSGTVFALGKDVTRLSEDERAEFRRLNIGYVFQAFRLFRALDAIENVALALEIAGQTREAARRLARETLERVGITGGFDRRPDDMSGGEKQRVAIARAMAGGQRLILADEPTAALDSASGRQVAELMRALLESNKRTVIVVSHDPRLLPFSDRVVELRDGRLANNE